MNEPIPSEYKGWWRIIDTSQWVSNGLDILGPAVISLTGGADRLRMHCLLANVNCKATKTGVSFTWMGCEPQKLCADCVALGILSLLAGMAVDDGDSRGQWRLSRNPCSPHASWRERRRLGHGHGFGQFSGRALGVANSRPIQGRTSSDLQTATLYSWCSPPRTGTAHTLLAGVGRIGGSQCAPNGACMCSPR